MTFSKNRLCLNKSKDYNKKTANYLAGGVHYNFRNPWDTVKIHFVSGKGSRLKDMDGNEYLDFFCKFGSNILGHGHKEYIGALKKALDYVLATNLSYLEYEVCKKICELIESVDSVRFCLSGTEAVQNALRLARAYTKKNKFIRFVSNYHGNADNIMGGKPNNNYEPTEYQGDPRGTFGRATDIMLHQSFLLPWNDADILEKMIYEHKHEIAAIIIEPICVNAKSRIPTSEYLHLLRRLCSENNIQLIFDEVITGFRVSLGGAQKIFDIKPDLTVLGKALSGGAVPMSAVGGKREIMDLYTTNNVIHAGTFNGYSLGLAAINKSLAILSNNNGNVYRHMNDYFTRILDIFKKCAETFGFEIIIHGHPTCSSFSCNSWENKSKIPTEFIEMVISRALSNNGILLSNTTTFYSNISINDNDIDLFKRRLSNVFKETIEKLNKINV